MDITGPGQHLDAISLIHAAITSFDEITTRHLDEVHPYVDEEGVIESSRARWEEVNARHAEEGNAHLVATMATLRCAFGTPAPGLPHTLVYRGTAEGAAPWLWIVTATSVDEADEILHSLPTFKEWADSERDWNNPDTEPRITLDRDRSGLGISDLRGSNDLRVEQAHRC
ncbi:hypothetical protein SAMN05216251_12718 [Actinacidiphila alni]|uniref:Uncharacterized protein n=1 Tax=Actinacidiphila alni TaxID=380248 RepID=A0A1I2L805_9ACTN|nr:hypothetical protein [Actinacidiphila alni]SFF74678.1 hypothetical protein SAMN05216251_12718 [Actinacidiphila alni]